MLSSKTIFVLAIAGATLIPSLGWAGDSETVLEGVVAETEEAASEVVEDATEAEFALDAATL